MGGRLFDDADKGEIVGPLSQAGASPLEAENRRLKTKVKALENELATFKRDTPKRDGSNRRHLDRVSGRIREHVLLFLIGCGVGNSFYMQDLTDYVVKNIGCAPNSPYRVLRDMMMAGAIEYTNLSRKESLYRVDRVAPLPSEEGGV